MILVQSKREVVQLELFSIRSEITKGIRIFELQNRKETFLIEIRKIYIEFIRKSKSKSRKKCNINSELSVK